MNLFSLDNFVGEYSTEIVVILAAMISFAVILSVLAFFKEVRKNKSKL